MLSVSARSLPVAEIAAAPNPRVIDKVERPTAQLD